ncbi:MAG: hypothetical protein ACE5HZ_05800 [Fidelibacterota bacterium]
MKEKNSRSKDRPGTYGFAPLGYVELAGIREALQKATDEISRLERENEKLKNRLKKPGPGPVQAERGWDYSHLGETEQRVIEAFLRGDFRKIGLQETCRRLSRKYGRKDTTYRKVFAKLRDYGVLSRIVPQGD